MFSHYMGDRELLTVPKNKTFQHYYRLCDTKNSQNSRPTKGTKSLMAHQTPAI